MALNFQITDNESQSTSTNSSLPPEYAQRMQEANLGMTNLLTQPFLNVSPYKVAGVNADELMGWDLTSTMAEDLWLAPQITAGNGQANYYSGNPAAQSSYSAAGPAAQSSYNSAGPANQAQFTATSPARGYNAQQGAYSSAGSAAQANPYGVGASGATAAAQQTGPAAQSAFLAAQQQQTGANDYQQFMNPYTREVVNTTQAQMGRANAEQDTARNAAYARAGAFGGSRQAVAQGVSDARFSQDVGNMTANLMSQGYDRATAMAMANTQLRQQTALQNSQLGTQNNQFNAGQSNQLAGLNAQLGTQANIASAGNQTQAGIASAQITGQLLGGNRDALNQMAMFNSGQSNNMALQNAMMGNQAGQFNAGQANQFALQDSQVMNNMALQNALMGNNMNQFNAGQQNQMGQFNAGQTNNMAQFDASQANANNQFNAGAQNSLNALQIQQQNQMNMQNAANNLTQADQTNRFANDEMQRKTSAIGMMLANGASQREIEQANLDVPWDTLQMMIAAANNTAQTGREQYGYQQQTQEENGFRFGF